MAPRDFIRSLFSRKADSGQSSAALERIRSSMTALSVKCDTLGAAYEKEKADVKRLAAAAWVIQPSDQVRAAKCDQDILACITAVSDACDKALADKDKDGVRKAAAALEKLIRQRAAVR